MNFVNASNLIFNGLPAKEAWIEGKKIWSSVVEFTNSWNLNILTPSPNSQFTIGLSNACNIKIDWGDNSSPVSYTSRGNYSKTYSSPGTYTVKISGYFISKNGYFRFAPGTNFITSVEPMRYIGNLIGPCNSTNIIGGFGVSHLFNNAINLSSVPGDLFAYNPQFNHFGLAFAASSLTAIPYNLFEKNRNALRFDGCFSSSKIRSIPSTLFFYNTAAQDFTNTFRYTPLTGIPPQLFDNCKLATNFDYTFANTSISIIPADLFKENINASSFVETFENVANINSTDYSIFLNSFISNSALRPKTTITMVGLKYNASGLDSRDRLIRERSWLIRDGGPEVNNGQYISNLTTNTIYISGILGVDDYFYKSFDPDYNIDIYISNNSDFFYYWPDDGLWYLVTSEGNTYISFQIGTSGVYALPLYNYYDSSLNYSPIVIRKEN